MFQGGHQCPFRKKSAATGARNDAEAESEEGKSEEKDEEEEEESEDKSEEEEQDVEASEEADATMSAHAVSEAEESEDNSDREAPVLARHVVREFWHPSEELQGTRTSPPVLTAHFRDRTGRRRPHRCNCRGSRGRAKSEEILRRFSEAIDKSSRVCGHQTSIC